MLGMRRKADSRRMIFIAIVGCAIVLECWEVFGLGGIFPNDSPVHDGRWPGGTEDLVNTTNRIYGYSDNAENHFFFSGTAVDFTVFLQAYSKIRGIETHRLNLH